jgi:hypothetical protein
VLAGYKRITARMAQEHIADMLQNLTHREAEIEADLERSRDESKETSTSRRSAGSGEAEEQIREPAVARPAAGLLGSSMKAGGDAQPG